VWKISDETSIIEYFLIDVPRFGKYLMKLQIQGIFPNWPSQVSKSGVSKFPGQKKRIINVKDPQQT